MGRTVETDLGAVVLGHPASTSVPRGETLFWEGDPSGSVYAVRSGRMKMIVTTPNGDELLLGWKEAGEVFGELSAIDGRPRSARAVAAVDSELAVMSRAEFLDALRRAPDVAVALLTDISDDLRRANSRITARKNDQIPVRVGHRLIELAAQFRRHGEPGTQISIEITQDDLAGWIGATRESTARALAGFRRRALIATERGRIVVLDPEALAAAVLDDDV